MSSKFYISFNFLFLLYHEYYWAHSNQHKISNDFCFQIFLSFGWSKYPLKVECTYSVQISSVYHSSWQGLFEFCSPSNQAVEVMRLLAMAFYDSLINVSARHGKNPSPWDDHHLWLHRIKGNCNSYSIPKNVNAQNALQQEWGNFPFAN